MSPKTTIERINDLQIFPHRDNKLETFLKTSTERDALSLIDYMTINDLIDLSCHKSDCSLVIILICMFASLNEGSICMHIDKTHLIKKVEGYVSKEEALYHVKEFLTALNNGLYANLITNDQNVYFPLIWQKDEKKDILYFKKYFDHEKSLEAKIKTLLQIKPLVQKDFIYSESIMDEVIYKKPVLLDNGKPMKLDKNQKDAIIAALKLNFLVISGGPGTGKTSILTNVLRCLVRDGFAYDRILICAPTGKAAHRISESIQKNLMSILNPTNYDLNLKNITVSTIHRLLKYNPAMNAFTYQPGNTLPADVVIVDEVSMVNICLMDDLLKAIDLKKTKIILLGDRDQLPSVDAGSVLADLVPRKKVDNRMKERIIILKKDYRSKGAILNITTEINKGIQKKDIKWPEPIDISEALKIGSGNCAIVQCHDESDWLNVLKTWANNFYYEKHASYETYIDLIKKLDKINFNALNNQGTKIHLDKLFSHLQKSIILSVIRDGIYGCIWINSFLAKHLYRLFDINGKSNRFNGAPIVVLRNDYNKELFNGDSGIMFRDYNGKYRSIFLQKDRYYSYPLDSIPAYELSFARTIHKSQGSEFDNVLIVFPDKGGETLLTQEIMYTALTRAKNRVFIRGKKSVLNLTVNRKIERLSGFNIN